MEKEKPKVPKVSIEPEGQQPISHLSRRSFLSRLGATGAAAATSGPLLGLAQTQFSQPQLEPHTVVNAAGSDQCRSRRLPITIEDLLTAPA
jgi:hypothetical protein